MKVELLTSDPEYKAWMAKYNGMKHSGINFTLILGVIFLMVPVALMFEDPDLVMEGCFISVSITSIMGAIILHSTLNTKRDFIERALVEKQNRINSEKEEERARIRELNYQEELKKNSMGFEIAIGEMQGHIDIPPCSRCLSPTRVLEEISKGGALKLSCEGCGASSWVKPHEEWDFQEARRLFPLLPLGAVTLEQNKDYIKSKNTSKRETLPESVRHEVWRRDEGRCVECGSKENLEFDHIIPVSKGGANTARNLQLLCQRCNRQKSNKI